MLIDDLFPSRFLKAADILHREVPCIIAAVAVEEMGDGARKPCLAFKGKQKLVVLNRLNSETLAGAYGRDTAGWVGKPVVLVTEKVLFQGRPVDAIRLRIPTAPQARRAAAVAPQPPPPAEDGPLAPWDEAPADAGEAF